MYKTYKHEYDKYTKLYYLLFAWEFTPQFIPPGMNMPTENNQQTKM